MKNETENKKKCVQCKKRKITSQDKEVSEFYLSKRSKDGFDRICKNVGGRYDKLLMSVEKMQSKKLPANTIKRIRRRSL
jgi:hypothetical protein